jgi:hypothetical protein
MDHRAFHNHRLGNRDLPNDDIPNDPSPKFEHLRTHRRSYPATAAGATSIYRTTIYQTTLVPFSDTRIPPVAKPQPTRPTRPLKAHSTPPQIVILLQGKTNSRLDSNLSRTIG